MKITAEIEELNNGSLWLHVEHEDPMESNSWPITDEEILPIYKACEDYMVKNPQIREDD